MKSFNLVFFALFSCYFNLGNALSSTATPITTNTPSAIGHAVPAKIELSYYTTTIKGNGVATTTILLNNQVIKDGTYICLPTKSNPRKAIVEECNKVTVNEIETEECHAKVTSTFEYGVTCDGGRFDTYSTTLPVIHSSCTESTTLCETKTRYTTEYVTMDPEEVTALPDTTEFSEEKVKGETTIVQDNVKTMVKLNYYYEECKPVNTTVDCVLLHTKSLPIHNFIPTTTTTTKTVQIQSTEPTETDTITVNPIPTSTNTDDENCGGKWDQCGGIGFKGIRCCQLGYHCHKYSDFFYQCI